MLLHMFLPIEIFSAITVSCTSYIRTEHGFFLLIVDLEL